MKNPKSLINNAIGNIGVTGNSGSQLLQALNEASSHLSTSTQLCSEILPSFYSTADLCPEHPNASAIASEADFDDYQVEIPEQTADLIRQALLSGADFNDEVNGTATTVKGLTFTDAEGYAYEFIDKSGLSSSGIEVFIATTLDPVDERDALIYRKNGKYYINNLVRSKGYYRQSELTTIVKLLPSILSILDWAECSYIGQEMYPALLSLCNMYNITIGNNTIFDCVRSLEIHFGLEASTNIQEGLAAIRVYLYNESYDVEYGKVAFYPDVISDAMESDSINYVLYQAVDQIKHNTFSASNFMAIINNSIPDARPSVRRVASSISNAYSAGGPLAAARIILEMLSSTSSVIAEDGHLEFSDNSNLVPKQYIAGLLATIFGSVLAVAGAVVSIFSRVLGVVISLIGTLVLSIPKAIKYDYQTATVAQVTGMDDPFGVTQTTIPCYPHGLWQTVIPKDWLHPIFQRMIDDGQTAFMIQVPGGYVFVGPSDTANNINAEFHPAVADYPSIVCGDGDSINDIYTPGEGHHIAGSSWLVSFYFSYQKMFSIETLYNIWSKARPLSLNFNGDGTLTSFEDDIKLRVAFMRNMALAYSFLCLSSSEYEWRTSWLYGHYAYLLGSTLTEGEKYIDNGWWFNTATDEDRHLYGSHYNFNVIPYVMFTPDDFIKMYHGTYFNDFSEGTAATRTRLNKVTEENFSDLVPGWNDIVRIVDHTNTSIEDELLRFETMYTTSFTSSSISVFDYATVGLPHSGVNFLINRNYLGDVMDIPQEFMYMVQTPKYDRSTFMFWVGFTTAVTVLATVATVIAAVRVKKWIVSRQASNAARAEAAWQNCVEKGATPENIAEYRSAVFKNNVFAKVTGGTKYSKTGFWGDTSSSDGSFSNLLSSSKHEGELDELTISGSPEISNSLDDIRVLIKGTEE